ncbi:ParB/RepB/Spo0J family partition protein [Paenibacillus sp. KACC 21273]|uniref:ParB/RepB/Spo0J family partition protein n=1 Tax=Paenibacillus sp. KACC 21273 TaxID=3025665 RepID=UPI002365B73D|nr:ParB/RepB/Spo0J family partition protein [Paenibacillus sp. KACC 21273]WDF49872.1 ParB/RepB/Spo0J family partition protein [Paenibacillus sp. KACC 21273]
MEVKNIPLKLIEEDKDQPRYNFEEENLKELAENIKMVGLLSPIKVLPLENGKYKLIFGHRRYKACSLLKMENIPAIISQNESEIDIYLQQLTENIQRENFTPVEEAEAFSKLMNDVKFRMSKMMLANKLGKNQQYISKKLELLNFGRNVQVLIHGEKRIIANKLAEEQVLPLKNVAKEYKDALAFKISEEEIPVNDVKKLAELFTTDDISHESKEFLLNEPMFKILNIWNEYTVDKKRKLTSPKYSKPQIANNSLSEIDIAENSLISSDYSNIEIVKRLNSLLNNLPGNHEISQEILSSMDSIKISNKKEFIHTIDALTDCLAGHLNEWKKIKAKISITKLEVIKNDK